MLDDLRRVVIGLGADQRSGILFDDTSPNGLLSAPGALTRVMWQTDASPASNEGSDDPVRPLSLAMGSGGTRFDLIELQPQPEMVGPGWHAVNSLDYGVIVRGEVTLLTETGEVTLRAGDTFVDRGVLHAWHDRGTGPMLMALVAVDAHPVGPAPRFDRSAIRQEKTMADQDDIQLLLDERAIQRCLKSYSRGCDRHDHDALMGVTSRFVRQTTISRT